MQQAIRIVTDSSSDLSPTIAQEHGIEVVPLNLHIGPEVFVDGELTSEQFWEKTQGPYAPTTSQPSVGAYEEVYERLVEAGFHVLCVALTGRHSGTYNAASVAAQRFEGQVTVFDSLSLSVGLGAQAVAAARAARAGDSMREIVARLERIRDEMRVYIVLDTLEFLRSGGRADAFIRAADRMTRVLNIKVLINVVDGQLKLAGAARSFKRGMRRVTDMVDQLGPLEMLAVVHFWNPEMASDMVDRLCERTGFPRERVWTAETRGVLAAHGGPGLLGILVLP